MNDQYPLLQRLRSENEKRIHRYERYAAKVRHRFPSMPMDEIDSLYSQKVARSEARHTALRVFWGANRCAISCVFYFLAGMATGLLY